MKVITLWSLILHRLSEYILFHQLVKHDLLIGLSDAISQSFEFFLVPLLCFLQKNYLSVIAGRCSEECTYIA